MKIGFAGERGAYAEAAAAALFKYDIATLPMRSYTAVFDMLDAGEISLGIVPIENSYVGAIHETFDLLRARHVYITSETEIGVAYALAGMAGAEEEGIKRIYAHPIALAQCEEYVRAREDINLIPRYDTENSERELVDRANLEEATLCSHFSATIRGLTVLRQNCNTLPDSTTRYICISKEPLLPDPDEGEPVTMLMFEMPHKPGALMRNLAAFAEEDINLTSLVTRPTRVNKWDYTTFVTFFGTYEDEKTIAVTDRLQRDANFVRQLGTYIDSKVD